MKIFTEDPKESITQLSFKKNGKNYFFKNYTFEKDIINEIKFDKKILDNLHDYQIKMLQNVVKNKGGIIVSEPRFGKTRISLAFIAHDFKPSTISFYIGVKDNIDKDIETLNKTFGFSFPIHKYHGQNSEISKDFNGLIMTTEETLLKRIDYLKTFIKNSEYKVDKIILDEIHNFLKKTEEGRISKYKNALTNIFKERSNIKILSLSATPYKPDKEIDIIEQLEFMDERMPKTELIKYFFTTYTKQNPNIKLKKNKKLNEEFKIIEKNFFHNIDDVSYKSNFNNLTLSFIKNNEKFQLVGEDDTSHMMQIEKNKIGTLINLLQRSKTQTIVFSKYKNNQLFFKDKLENLNIDVVIINGDTKLNLQKDKIIASAKIILFQIDKAEAIDIPWINNAIYTYIPDHVNKLKQSIGRIFPIEESKKYNWMSSWIIYNEKYEVNKYLFFEQSLKKHLYAVPLKIINKYNYIFESNSDKVFFDKYITTEHKSFNKQELNISKNVLKALHNVSNVEKFFVVGDNDKLKSDLDYEKYITFNQLFNVPDNFSTLEEILKELKIIDDVEFNALTNNEIIKSINHSFNDSKGNDFKEYLFQNHKDYEKTLKKLNVTKIEQKLEDFLREKKDNKYKLTNFLKDKFYKYLKLDDELEKKLISNFLEYSKQ